LRANFKFAEHRVFRASANGEGEGGLVIQALQLIGGGRTALFGAFVALTLGTAPPSLAQQWGDLEMDFVLPDGFKATKITPDKDVEFCGKHPLFEERVVVDPVTKGVKNVAVYLLAASGKKVPVHPDYEKTAKDEVLLNNKNCRYEPHVLALRTSQTLVLGNADPIGHNMKAEFFKNPPFNDLVPAGGTVKKATLKSAESTFVPVTCSIHMWMGSHVLVRDDPYVGISDEKGHLVIKNLPVGEHTFIVWQENVGYITKPIKVDGKPTTWGRGGRMKATIKPGVNKLGKVELTPESLKLQ
jgi:hypothetical protein